MKIKQMKTLGVMQTPIDFGVSRLKVKVISTCRNRLFEQIIGFRSITLERLVTDWGNGGYLLVSSAHSSSSFSL